MNSLVSPIDWSTWTWKIPATLMFVIKDGNILLIEKKRGHGAGKINGPGGKMDAGETSLACAIRETHEELLIMPQSPRKMGELHFAMSDYPDIICHVFRAEDYQGTPSETDEAVPVWFPLDQIPYHRMWEDDEYWLPLLIDNKTFVGKFAFSGDTMLWKEVTVGVHWT